ncbi:hypothetical protein IQ241_18370 [Romeria aff. gracilis LEGE 07310]|uniref:S9 family peptidase n=1 Tax=Vasconcelosia minhoensis LEGE 07310 TaxID=915328 RepID=A0A8J7DDW9_9CYAN|nr:hypothetical protein [Romeria gracilis]MBE9079238.1 hypothetical protein [Romeria aff. gracilis LEGE 07310]
MFRSALALTISAGFAVPLTLAAAADQSVQDSQMPSIASIPAEAKSDGNSWQLLTEIPGDRQPVAFGDGGRRLLTLNPDMLQVWQTHSGKAIAEIVTDGDTRFIDAALSPDGNRAAAIVQTLSTQTLQLQIWHVETGAVIRQRPQTLAHSLGEEAFPVGSSLNQLAFAPDGNLVSQVVLAADAETAPAEVRLRRHNGETGQVLQSLETGPDTAVRQFTFSLDGTLLAGVSTMSTGPESAVRQVVDIWRLTNGTHLMRLEPLEDNRWSLVDIVFNPAGSLEVLSQWLYDVRLDTWDVTTGKRLQRRTRISDIDRQDRFGRLSPDGTHYFVRSDVAGTRLINLDHQTVQTLPIYAETALFDRQGHRLAIATQTDIHLYMLKPSDPLAAEKSIQLD